MVACFNGREDVVKVLLSSGRCGNLEARSKHGQMVLSLASWAGHVGVVRRLLEAGADAEARDETGMTAPDGGLS